MIPDERLEELAEWIQGIPNIYGIDRQDLVGSIKELLEAHQTLKDMDGIIEQDGKIIKRLIEDANALAEYLTLKQPDGFTEYGLTIMREHKSLMKELA